MGLFFSCRKVFHLKQFLLSVENCVLFYYRKVVSSKLDLIKSYIYQWVWTSLISVVTESVLALSVLVLLCFVSNLGRNKQKLLTLTEIFFLIKTDSHLFFCRSFCKLIPQFLQVRKAHKCFLFNHMFQLSFFQNIKVDVKLNSWSI